jgi:NAD(P)H-flavin reductase
LEKTMKSNEIVEKKLLAPTLVFYRVHAPEVAQSVKAGQFIILRTDETAERLPLTVVDHDPQTGTIDLIVQEIGVATRKLGRIEKGDAILDLVGPLGHASVIEKIGTVAAVGGGVGTAPLFPIVRAFKEAGNRLLTVLGARTAELLILEEEMKRFSDRLDIATDDGSRGEKGFVTGPLKRLLETESVDLVMAIGPALMMKAVAETTKPFGVKTIVSLNALMLDGTGMCGGCRVTVKGRTQFVCVDGPEFDAHEVDFNELVQRLGMYRHEERTAAHEYECKLNTAGV